MTEFICLFVGFVIGIVYTMTAEEVKVCKCTGTCNQGRNCTCTSG